MLMAVGHTAKVTNNYGTKKKEGKKIPKKYFGTEILVRVHTRHKMKRAHDLVSSGLNITHKAQDMSS